jgi:glutathione S-transferase
MEQITLFGAHVSPYVRKTRLVLAFKNIKYSHIAVVPFGSGQPAEFKENSPLGKIPLLKFGEQYIPDSSVICSFLERQVSSPSMLPANNLEITQAQWLEVYADTFMVSSIGGHLFAEKILAPAIFKREPVQSDIDKALNEEIPAIFDYLSKELKGDYLVGNQVTIADIAVCSVFVAMHHCQVKCDPAKWPELAAYIDRVTSLDFFQKIITEEQMILKVLAG